MIKLRIAAIVGLIGALASGAMPTLAADNGVLSVVCFPSVTNNTITWTSSAADGMGLYNFAWTGPAGGTTANDGTAFIFTATANGTYSATVNVSDQEGNAGSATCTATVSSIPNGGPVNPTSTLPITTGSLSVACFPSVISNQVTWTGSAANGTPPYNFTWAGPAGGTTANGGTAFIFNATANGSYSATLHATDQAGAQGSATCTGTVNSFNGPGVPTPTSTLPVSNGNLSVACFPSVVNDTITWTSSAAGGAAPYGFTWAGPAGGTTANGGTAFIFNATANGSYSATVSVTDQAGNAGSATCTGTVSSINGGGTGPINPVQNPTPTGTLSVSCFPSVMSNTIEWTTSAAGGTAPYGFTWSGQSGTVGGNGTWFEATFPTNGTYSETVTATDQSGNQGSATCAGTVSSNT